MEQLALHHVLVTLHACCHGIFYLGSAEKLFNMCDEYADGQKKKSQVWPLQNALLILCPVSEAVPSSPSW